MSNELEQYKENISLKLFIVLSHAYKSLMEHALRDIQRHGLNPTEFAVLELLYSKGPHPLQQIGEKILLSSGSITYVVDQLGKKGYVERQNCEKDRRITFAQISPQGVELMNQIFPQHVEALEHAMDGLNPQEKKQAVDLLKRLGLFARNKLN